MGLKCTRRVKDKSIFSKWIVAIIIALNVIFTIAVLIVFFHTGNEPAVLIGSWFAFTTGELWAMAKIKTNKNNDDQGSV